MLRMLTITLASLCLATGASASGLIAENFAGFTGSGFAPSPAAGQLDSDLWRVTGLSDGAGTFSGTHTAGDFARGSSTGGVTTGGTYAFDVGAGDIALGVQPTGSDFTPGSITLRLQNTTGSTVTAVSVSYDVWVLNDQGRGNSFNLSYAVGPDETGGYTAVPALDHTSPAAADGNPAWAPTPKAATLPGLTWLNGEFLFLQWTGDDVSGSGSRDEFGLDDVVVCVETTIAVEATTWSGIKELFREVR